MSSRPRQRESTSKIGVPIFARSEARIERLTSVVRHRRKLAASPPAGDRPDDPRGQTIDPDAVRDSWTAAQRDVEDLSALRAHEDATRRKIEEAEASRRRREREEARAAAAAAAKAKAKAKEDDGVIDLCDSDDEAAGTTKETKGSDGGSNGGGSDKENEVVDEVEAIPAKEPTRAELAAAAAKRRAQYEAHIASFGGGGGTGKGGGYIQGGQIVSGPPPVAGGGGGGNPLLNPPGAYVPPAGRSNHDLNIGTDETAECRDVSGSWYSARACLDTGNGGGTLVTKNLAIKLGLVDGFGRPAGGGSVRMVTVRGVVAGASERVPVVSGLTYRIKGKEMTVDAGVTECDLDCDLLISRAEIMAFEADGYKFTAGRASRW